MNEHAYETINSFRQESQGVRNMNNPVYCSEHRMAADVVDVGYAEIGQTSRNVVARPGRVRSSAADGLNQRTAPSLHPQISENSITVNQSPSPYLMPRLSSEKENRTTKLRECYEVQTMKQLTSEGTATCYTNTVTHIIPTDPQTGYSTLLRPDEIQSPSANLNPMDPLYDSIKEKDKCVVVRSDGDGGKVVERRSNPCSMPLLDAKPQASYHDSSNNPSNPILFESVSTTQVPSSEIVVLIDDPETGYSVLRPDKIPGLPPGAGSVPHYDTIKLNSLKQQNSDGDNIMVTLNYEQHTDDIFQP